MGKKYFYYTAQGTCCDVRDTLAKNPVLEAQYYTIVIPGIISSGQKHYLYCTCQKCEIEELRTSTQGKFILENKFCDGCYYYQQS